MQILILRFIRISTYTGRTPLFNQLKIFNSEDLNIRLTIFCLGVNNLSIKFLVPVLKQIFFLTQKFQI